MLGQKALVQLRNSSLASDFDAHGPHAPPLDPGDGMVLALESGRRARNWDRRTEETFSRPSCASFADHGQESLLLPSAIVSYMTF